MVSMFSWMRLPTKHLKFACKMSLRNHLPASGLLFGAIVWGLIWYPYRQLELAGISGIQSSLITYGIALLIGIGLFTRYLREPAHLSKAAIFIGMAAGWANLSYVLAVLEGEVMRVLLLFYLAPLWTLFLARWLLAERVGRRGWMVMMLSLTGMFTMLWQGKGLPLPQNGAEWLALSAGMAFAATNVLTRWAGHLSLQTKSLAVWVGVCAIALVFFVFENHPLPSLATIGVGNWLLMAIMGVLLAATTWLVQLGVTHTPANRAAIIFMFELVVAAVSSYFLAGEAMTLREWMGGTMIIVAALFSGQMESAET